MKSIYTIPKVVKYDDLKKSWFVYFRYDKKLFRFKYGINYIDNYNKRLVEANAIQEALLQKLKEGWNPNIPDVVNEYASLTLINAIDFSLSKKKSGICAKTYSGYVGTSNFIKTAIIDLKYSNLLIQETKRLHIRLILEQAKQNRSWTNNSYNKHLNHLKAILSELIQWDIIDNNPAHKINNLPIAESEANIPANDEDVEKIKKELSANHKAFYNFVLTIFHTGIRPVEILKIKLDMICLEKSEIILPPEITKSNKKRIVPINKHLLEAYKKLELENLPSNYFLFGSFREPGKGNIGKFNDFVPGPTSIKRDTATKRWEKIIKKGLGIDMNMYALKHLGANKKILAGLDLDSLRELYGHKSKLMTMKYAKVVTKIHRINIMENSPDF